MLKYDCNKIAFQHGFPAVNLLHIFGKTFAKNGSGGLLLKSIISIASVKKLKNNQIITVIHIGYINNY